MYTLHASLFSLKARIQNIHFLTKLRGELYNPTGMVCSSFAANFRVPVYCHMQPCLSKHAGTPTVWLTPGPLALGITVCAKLPKTESIVVFGLKLQALLGVCVPILLHTQLFFPHKPAHWD